MGCLASLRLARSEGRYNLNAMNVTEREEEEEEEGRK
jgi:hypothetical protein